MGDVVFYLCLTILVNLFAGDPGLMDTIQAHMNSATVCRP